MAQYLIMYDNRPPRNYAALYSLLSSWKAVRAQQSVWLAHLKGPASVVRDIVRGTLEGDDSVMVIEIEAGADWATYAAPAAANWLSNYIAPAQIAA